MDGKHSTTTSFQYKYKNTKDFPKQFVNIFVFDTKKKRSASVQFRE
jgi:hypothetical protein